MQKPKVGHKGIKGKKNSRTPTSCKNISKIESEGTWRSNKPRRTLIYNNAHFKIEGDCTFYKATNILCL